MLTAATMAVILIGLSPGVASAAPKSQTLITLSCPGRPDVTLVTSDGGNWSVGRDVASNAVYQPVGFADEYFVVRDADGNVLVEDFDPGPRIKNGNRKGQTIIQCQYSGSFSGVEENFGGYIEVEFGGTVYGVLR